MTGMAYGFAICSALFNDADLFLLHKSVPFTLYVAEKFFFQHTIHEALRCCQRSSLHCKPKNTFTLLGPIASIELSLCSKNPLAC